MALAEDSGIWGSAPAGTLRTRFRPQHQEVMCEMPGLRLAPRKCQKPWRRRFPSRRLAHSGCPWWGGHSLWAHPGRLTLGPSRHLGTQDAGKLQVPTPFFSGVGTRELLGCQYCNNPSRPLTSLLGRAWVCLACVGVSGVPLPPPPPVAWVMKPGLHCPGCPLVPGPHLRLTVSRSRAVGDLPFGTSCVCTGVHAGHPVSFFLFIYFLSDSFSDV